MKKKYFLCKLLLISFLSLTHAADKKYNDNPLNINNTNCSLEDFNTTNILVTEDTFVRAGRYADNNYGSSTELNIKSTSNSSFVRETLMKFDLSAYENITSAKIYLYARAQAPINISAYSLVNDSWSENSVTWNNAPDLNSNIGSVQISTSYAWVEIDIPTAVINDFNALDKIFSIGLKDDNTINKTVFIYSKENSTQYTPYIQIEGTLNGGGNVAVTGVTVSPTNATIGVNNTQQLSATISPSNATNQAVSWTSSNSSIASVNSTGLVTGETLGTAIITATTDDGNITSSATITVENITSEPSRDLYLIIGQSNTAGRGNIEAQDMIALNGVDLFNGSTWESAENTSEGLNRYSTIRKIATTQGLNYAYTFGRTINEDTGKQIGLVVNARGGTSIDAWSKGASPGYYAAAISQINLALTTPNTTLKGILWHQGESNRNDSAYLTKLSNLISDLRSDLGIPDLPFVAGQISMEREDSETFNANLETLPSIINNTDYVESDGLGTTDLTHFDSNAQRILGERYASKVLNLVFGYPSITCLDAINQTADNSINGAIITYSTPVGTDNSPGATTVQTEGLASGALFPIGVTINTFVVTNTAGNTATCSFTVTVMENTCGILIDENNFDSSWGIWNDGGADCLRNSNNTAFANGGIGLCVRLRDNTSSSVMTTDALDLSSYSELTVDFNYIAHLMESGEDFWLQISTDGGNNYITLEDWVISSELVNGIRYFESVTIPGPFPSNTYLRFRMDATADSDFVYIDDVQITGCLNSNALSKESPRKEKIVEENKEIITPTTKLFYNNPVDNQLIIKSNSTIGEVSIYSMNGMVLKNKLINSSNATLDISNLPNGLFVLILNNNGEKITKLIVKK